MAALNENWAVSRPLIFKALLLSQSPGSTTQQCDVCHDAPWVVRCDECSGRRMCYKCDSTVIVKKSSQKNLSADCRPSVGRLSAVCWPTVGRLSADCRPSVGRLSAVCWPTDGRQVFPKT